VDQKPAPHAGAAVVDHARPLGKLTAERREILVRRFTAESGESEVPVASFNSAH
jgi:hypothetical protein